MTEHKSRGSAALRRWLLARLLLGLLALPGLFLLRSSLVTWLMESSWNVHGSFKLFVEWWGLLLLHQQILPWLLMGAALGAVVLALTRATIFWASLAGLALLSVALLPSAQPVLVLLLVCILAINMLPPSTVERHERLFRGLAWVPGSCVLFPLPTAQVVFNTFSGLPRVILSALLCMGLAVLCFCGSLLLSIGPQGHAAEFVQWPDGQLDQRIKVVDRAPEGIVGDFHEIQVLGQRAVVAAEGSGRILSISLADGSMAEYPVAARKLERGEVGSVSSFTDPNTGLTWIMDHFNRLAVLEYSAGRWVHRDEVRIPFRMSFPYMRWAPELRRLLLVEVAALSAVPGHLVLLDLSGREHPGQCWFHDKVTGQPVGAPRNVDWIPSLRKLVISPDYSSWLYLVDPVTCDVEPWLDTGSFNARMLWVPQWERLLLAKPGGRHVWVVDPATSSVERKIPTQVGVRVLGVDAGRDILLTGSVLTGNILVQDASDGRILDRFGTVMPMVRDMAVDPASGQALVSTWTVLYQIPYLQAIE